MAIVSVTIAVVVIVAAIAAINTWARTQTSSVLLATTSNSIEAHALLKHAHVEAFLETTRLARLSSSLVNFTLSSSWTGVFYLALNGSFEEGFTGLARAEAVVFSASYIAANKASLLSI